MTQRRASEKKQARILRALEAHDGRAHTGQIREMTGLKSNVIGYHMDALRGERYGPYTDAPAVESDGQEQLDGVPLAANRYRLTDAGRDVLQELDADEPIGAGGGQLRSELEDLREEHEQLKENFNELVERLETDADTGPARNAADSD